MKVKIVKEVKRSDGLWRFACGDVLIFDKAESVDMLTFSGRTHSTYLMNKNVKWSNGDVFPRPPKRAGKKKQFSFLRFQSVFVLLKPFEFFEICSDFYTSKNDGEMYY